MTRPTVQSDEDIANKEAQLKLERAKRQQLHNDRVLLLKMPEFQRVIADVIAKGGMFRSTFTGNSQSYWLSGKQDFAREIWTDMASANQELAFDLLKPKFGEQYE